MNTLNINNVVFYPSGKPAISYGDLKKKWSENSRIRGELHAIYDWNRRNPNDEDEFIPGHFACVDIQCDNFTERSGTRILNENQNEDLIFVGTHVEHIPVWAIRTVNGKLVFDYTVMVHSTVNSKQGGDESSDKVAKLNGTLPDNLTIHTYDFLRSSAKTFHENDPRYH